MTSDTGPDLGIVCAEMAGDLDEVSSTADGDTLVYRRGETVFARVAGSTLQLRLPEEILEAALRTPDTAPGTERDWIRFTPAGNERHVTDRTAAWFQTAWRHAVPG